MKESPQSNPAPRARIALRTGIAGPIELNELFFQAWNSQRFDEALSVEIAHQGVPVPFQELFETTWPSTGVGEEANGDAVLEWCGETANIHGLGRGWSRGRLEILGNAGDCLGEGMTGGTVIVRGDAGDCVGRGMSGGRILVAGQAGNYLGGPTPGTLKGMTGGEIHVAGSAGSGLGERMRRGTLVVQGATGKDVGREMLAGTILLGTAPQCPLGVGMKRGTIVLLEPPPANTLFPGPHFDYAVRYEPTFLRVLLKHLEQTAGWPVSAPLLAASYDRYSGDMLEGGRGEILVRIP